MSLQDGSDGGRLPAPCTPALDFPMRYFPCAIAGYESQGLEKNNVAFPAVWSWGFDLENVWLLLEIKWVEAAWRCCVSRLEFRAGQCVGGGTKGKRCKDGDIGFGMRFPDWCQPAWDPLLPSSLAACPSFLLYSQHLATNKCRDNLVESKSATVSSSLGLDQLKSGTKPYP